MVEGAEAALAITLVLVEAEEVVVASPEFIISESWLVRFTIFNAAAVVVPVVVVVRRGSVPLIGFGPTAAAVVAAAPMGLVTAVAAALLVVPSSTMVRTVPMETPIRTVPQAALSVPVLMLVAVAAVKVLLVAIGAAVPQVGVGIETPAAVPLAVAVRRASYSSHGKL